jgi:hypothetical protein
MSKITISIETENAAFEENPEAEVISILRKLADWFYDNGLQARNVLDSNGNKVGKVRVVE